MIQQAESYEEKIDSQLISLIQGSDLEKLSLKELQEQALLRNLKTSGFDNRKQVQKKRKAEIFEDIKKFDQKFPNFTASVKKRKRKKRKRKKFEESKEAQQLLSNWMQNICKRAENYTQEANTCIVETFNSVIAKYAPKRVYFKTSYPLRANLAALCWNEGSQVKEEILFKLEHKQ